MIASDLLGSVGEEKGRKEKARIHPIVTFL